MTGGGNFPSRFTKPDVLLSLMHTTEKSFGLANYGDYAPVDHAAHRRTDVVRCPWPLVRRNICTTLYGVQGRLSDEISIRRTKSPPRSVSFRIAQQSPAEVTSGTECWTKKSAQHTAVQTANCSVLQRSARLLFYDFS